MSTYLHTTIAISVHLPTQNPVFGEGATHVILDDECGGPFLILKQSDDDARVGEIRVDMEELEEIVKAARRLIKGWPKEGE